MKEGTPRWWAAFAFIEGKIGCVELAKIPIEEFVHTDAVGCR